MSDNDSRISATQKLAQEKPIKKNQEANTQVQSDEGFKLPKYTNLNEKEQKWVMYNKQKYGEEGA